MNGFFYDNPLDILKFFLLGALAGVYYDFFRIIRIARRSDSPVKSNPFYLKVAPKHFFEKREKAPLTGAADTVLVFIEDLLFTLGCALAFIFLTYATNEGEIRIFGFILGALGFTLYYISIGKAVIYLSGHIIFSAKILIYWILYIIIKPIRIFCGFAMRTVRWIFAKTVGALAAKISYRRQLAYTKKLCSELLKNAENGFTRDAEVEMR